MDKWLEEERDKKPVRTGTLPPWNSKGLNDKVWRCTEGMT